MNKNSFLEALRNIFKKARVADVESVNPQASQKKNDAKN